MTSDQYRALEAALAHAGAPTHWSNTVKEATVAGSGPVAVFVNTDASARPYVDLLIEALPGLTSMEQEMVIRALSERGMPKAGPILAAMMINLADASAKSSIGWAVGNALATIQDPATFDMVVILCTDRRLGTARQMLFSLLPRIGTQAAYDAALAGLEDETVRGHALEAVGRFGRPEALDRIRVLQTKKGLYENKAKATAIRRLERIAARNSADA